MSTLDEIRPAVKVWLERGGRPILGRGGADILEAIMEERSLSRAAKRLGMSQRYIWSYLNRMSKAVGAKLKL
ncbi:MAG: LysR family transcriptional regulator [Candidatus Bathyarchaeia archaeon]